MNELTEKKTPEQLGAEIRMYVDAGRRISLLCGIEIGRRLVQAKEMLDHGEWLPWLEKETEFSERSAQRYMKLFEEYGASQQGLFGPETNAPTLSDLPISKAFALLSVPESEREDFAQEVDAEHISVRELEQVIRDRDEAKTQLDEAKEQIRELARLNQKLESRPVEVAVERDEEAIAAAAKEAREQAEAEAVKAANKTAREHDKTLKELQGKISSLQEQLSRAETEREEAVKKTENAGQDTEQKLQEATREAERIRAELEEARKQLKAADAEVAKFGIWFNQMQADFNKMMETLREINEKKPETGEKLTKAAAILLEALLKRMKPDV